MWKTARRGRPVLFEEKVSHSPQEHEGDDNPTEHEDDSGMDQVEPEETRREQMTTPMEKSHPSRKKTRRMDGKSTNWRWRSPFLPERYKKMR